MPNWVMLGDAYVDLDQVKAVRQDGSGKLVLVFSGTLTIPDSAGEEFDALVSFMGSETLPQLQGKPVEPATAALPAEPAQITVVNNLPKIVRHTTLVQRDKKQNIVSSTATYEYEPELVLPAIEMSPDDSG